MGEFGEQESKEVFRIQFPRVLRFAFIWTVFFSIIGIVLQSFAEKTLIFKEFFTSNFVNWLSDFGNFANLTDYPDIQTLLFTIFEDWYYFFYLGGLLALIWGLIAWMVNWEIVFRKRRKPENTSSYQETVQQTQEPIQFTEEKIENKDYHDSISEWLEEGLRLLSEGKIAEASLIYDEIRREYDSDYDPDKELYRRINDFYNGLLDSKS